MFIHTSQLKIAGLGGRAAGFDASSKNAADQHANRGWTMCHAAMSNVVRQRLMGAFTQFTSIFLAIAFLFLAIFMKPALALTISEFPAPTATSNLTSIAAGPDGNLWFTENSGVKIGKMTTAGVITEYPISGQPDGITSGPDGNLWFANSGGNKIGKITPAGVITEFALPTAFSTPGGIAAGPDGNLWFTEGGGNRIGKITTAGVITEYAVLPTANSLPGSITAGPDGNLWFTELNTGMIGRITTAGVITEFPGCGGCWPRSIVSGPDGNLWFTEDNGNRIDKITTAGVVTGYLLPTGTPYTNSSQPEGITVGPDGNLWFTEGKGNKIGMITTAGVITEYAAPTAASWPLGIATGLDGRIWFLENSGNKAGAVGPATMTGVASSLNPSTNGQSVTFTVTVVGSTPTGAVQFKDGTTNLGTPVALSAGSATYSTSALSAASHSITAVYGGDVNNVGSTSTALSQTVNAAPVNGACVTGQTLTAAPTNPNLCTAGTASAVTSGTTSYTWSCNGSNGGSNATSCSAIRNYVVTASVSGGNGTISANQNVAYNATPSFTLTPNAGYISGPVTGTCGGALSGNSYTTNAVTASCTVVAGFTLRTAYSGPTATGTGTATATLSGNGGPNCGFTTAQFILPNVSTPAGVSFPHGLLDFTLGGCTSGSTVTLAVTYPSAVLAGTQYWKYGPTPGGGTNSTPHWYTIPAVISGNTITFSITDGGLGDDDLTVNGTIVDQGGAGVQAQGNGATAIPTLSEWGVILLAGVLGLFGMVGMRRRGVV